jgi:hypothetical protein
MIELNHQAEVVVTTEVASSSHVNNATIEVSALSTEVESDMGYEDCAPTIRRGSLSIATAKERRASIKAVMADPTLSPITKRRSIQHLMDGRRNSATIGNVSMVAPPDVNNSPSDAGEMGGSDKKPNNDESYVPINLSITRIAPVCNDQTRRAEQMRPHCPHYERNCTMIAPCCGAAFGCRICHDDCTTL